MLNMVKILIAAEEGQTTPWLMWLLVGVLLVVMFVLPMITNRKRQKEVNEMFDSIQVGDEVMTIGGIMGKIVELKNHDSGEKLMVIETGDENKTTMTFTVQALRINYTKNKLRQMQSGKNDTESSKETNKEEQIEDAKSEDLDVADVTKDE